MNLNELFDALKVTQLLSERKRLVEQGVAEGLDIKDIQEMLDYLDLQRDVATPSSKPTGSIDNSSSEPKAS